MGNEIPLWLSKQWHRAKSPSPGALPPPQQLIWEPQARPLAQHFPLPVEEDGFHQGDHIPARVVPGAHDRDVQELPRDKRCLLEPGYLPPCRGPSALPYGLCYRERLHNPALPFGKELQMEVGIL